MSQRVSSLRAVRPNVAVASSDVCDLPARVLARRLRAGDITASETLEAFLERIDERNPVLNAVVSIDVERARHAAEEADAAFDRGEILGPLHGVPITLKDGLEVAGLRTTLGTTELDHIATVDSTVAARLRAAGAIVVGHTNVAPWLADYQTDNPVFGCTKNPWDVTRTPGGSSGGAAAAVAAGMTPFEIVSDLAGSVRHPAHCCGVYGLKTTEHRVPLTGFFSIPDSPRTVRVMSSLGPMARNLDDLRLALKLVAGPDGFDSDVPPVPLGRRAPVDIGSLCLAIAPTLPGVAAADVVRQEVDRVTSRAWDLGARVETCLPHYDWDASSRLFGQLVSAITSPDDRRMMSWYLSALDQRDRLIAAWDTYFADVDVLVLPPAPTTAYTHRKPGTPLSVDGAKVDYLAQGAFLTFCNLLGLPSLVGPAGFDDDGLPIGVQLVGARWSECKLIEIARAFEEAGILPGFRAPVFLPTGG